MPEKQKGPVKPGIPESTVPITHRALKFKATETHPEGYRGNGCELTDGQIAVVSIEVADKMLADWPENFAIVECKYLGGRPIVPQTR